MRSGAPDTPFPGRWPKPAESFTSSFSASTVFDVVDAEGQDVSVVDRVHDRVGVELDRQTPAAVVRRSGILAHVPALTAEDGRAGEAKQIDSS